MYTYTYTYTYTYIYIHIHIRTHTHAHTHTHTHVHIHIHVHTHTHTHAHTHAHTHTHTHTYRYSQPPDKIVKYFDRVHRRGAVVSDIVSMTTTHSVQSVAYEVVRSCPEGFTPSSEDRRCFSELAEFTNSSPTLNSIASNLIVRRLKRKGSSSTCSSIIRELLPLEELKISSSSDDDDDVDSSQYQKHQPLSQSSKKKNSYTTTASSRESEGKLSVGASFLSPSKPATAVAGGVVGADEKTDLLQGDFSPSSSSSLINVQYDPWSSVLKLVRAAKLHPQAEVLLYCMSLFPCCPLPKRLVKKMAEYLVETSSGRGNYRILGVVRLSVVSAVITAGATTHRTGVPP